MKRNRRLRQQCQGWAIKRISDSYLDGHREHLEGGAAVERPVEFSGHITKVFATRAAARKYIEDHYSYFRRPDLRAQPHAWKMPRPVKVIVVVSECQ